MLKTRVIAKEYGVLKHYRNQQYVWDTLDHTMAADFRFILFVVLCKHGLEEARQFVVDAHQICPRSSTFPHLSINDLYEHHTCWS